MVKTFYNSILLVDDDEITNFLHKELLSKVHIAEDIVIATNGEEALSLMKKGGAENHIPDLILLDINMPVMNGFEFLEQFKKLPQEKIKKTKIIALTTSNNERDKEKLKQLGIQQIMIKPLTEEKLLKEIA